MPLARKGKNDKITKCWLAYPNENSVNMTYNIEKIDELKRNKVKKIENRNFVSPKIEV